MLKKVMYKLSVLLDILKGFIINILLIVLIIFFGCTIIHNTLKLADLDYEGEYRNLIKVDDRKLMNVTTFGQGEKTIVILPGYGSQEPTIQYKAIVDKLKENYKVVVVEYYGYGLSMDVDFDRTIERVANEIKSALANMEVYEFILMPHSLSNIYAMKMIENYPSAIQGVISLDGIYPNQYSESFFYDEYLKEYHNVQLTAILEMSGFARILSYVKPDFFYINQMQNAGIWGETEVKILRYGLAESYLTTAMVNEMKLLKDNADLLKEFKYPETLPVLQILSTEIVDEYNNNKINNLIKKDAKQYAKDLISNQEIQFITVVEGEHLMQYTSYEEVASKTIEFIETGNVQEKEDINAIEENENLEPNDIDVSEEDSIIENKIVENVVENKPIVIQIDAKEPTKKEPEVAPITGNVLSNQQTVKEPEPEPELEEEYIVAEIQGSVQEEENIEQEIDEVPEEEEIVDSEPEVENIVTNEPIDGNVIKIF